MPRSGKRWYLVYAKSRQESVAETNLRRQGYVTYLPLARLMRRRNGRRVSASGPMFPRYLFVQLDETSDNWGPIRSTLGVVSIVHFGRRAATVPSEFISSLKNREDADGLQPVSLGDFKSGGRVRITEGGLSGYEGVFIARTSRERVVVLLEILGKQTRAQLDANAIESVQ